RLRRIFVVVLRAVLAAGFSSGCCASCSASCAILIARSARVLASRAAASPLIRAQAASSVCCALSILEGFAGAVAAVSLVTDIWAPSVLPVPAIGLHDCGRWKCHVPAQDVREAGQVSVRAMAAGRPGHPSTAISTGGPAGAAA